MDHRPHIVVVEDEPTQRQLLCDYLDKQNFRVSAADGGGVLRRLVERELPRSTPRFHPHRARCRVYVRATEELKLLGLEPNRLLPHQ